MVLIAQLVGSRRRVSSLLGNLALVTMFVVAPTSAADAARPIAPTMRDPVIHTAPRVGPPTSRVVVTGRRFGPDGPIRVRFDGDDIAAATSDHDGSFVARFKVPAAAAPGAHTIDASNVSNGAFARTSFLVRTDWMEPLFDRGSNGFNPYENVLDPAKVPGLTQRWTFSTDGSAVASALAGGTLFVATTTGRLYALDADSGAMRWSVTIGSGTLFPPAVWHRTVYVVAEDPGGELAKAVALDAGTGRILWSTRVFVVKFIPVLPIVSKGLLYVGIDAGIVAFDARTGAQVWIFHLRDESAGALAMGSGLIFDTEIGGMTYAVDARTGQLKWTFYPVWSQPAYARGVVYLCTYHGLVALTATTGFPVWPRRSVPCTSAAAIAGDTLYVPDRHVIRALDVRTGAVRWTHAIPPASVAPVVADGVVYMGTLPYTALARPEVFAIDGSTGDRLWSMRFASFSPSSLSTPTIVANGVAYVCVGDVFALSSGIRERPRRLHR
jgi:outer membrane protein assembly factor BamB